jgi:hypothetical protein
MEYYYKTFDAEGRIYQDDLPILLGIGSRFEMYNKTFKVCEYVLPDPLFESDYDIVIISREIKIKKINPIQVIRDIKLKNILKDNIVNFDL